MISALVLLLFYLMMMLIISPSIYGLLLLQPGSPNKHLDSADINTSTSTLKSEQATLIHRKLLIHGRCTNRDISISQSRDSSTSGIPKYIVEIVNTCVSGCAPSNIHLHCGWFASARIVNPRVFKRLGYDDCLVKAGGH